MSTANLDGEINLKPRSQILKQNKTETELQDLEVLIEADQPNHDMLHFNGKYKVLEHDDQQAQAVLSEPEPTVTQSTPRPNKSRYY